MGKKYPKLTKQDRKIIVNGITAEAFDADAFVFLMRLAREKLDQSIRRGSVTPLMHFTYEYFEKSASRLSDGKMACRNGCSHCCNIWTDAYAPEILFVAKQLSASEGGKATASIKDTGEFSSKVSFEQRDNLPIPCPLLIEDSCSLYRFRPLNCRTAVSLDADACRKAFMEGQDIEIPVPPGWANLGQAYSMALKGAIFHAGLACESYEWNSALKLALENSQLEQQWLSGKDVFSGTPIAAPPPPFSHPFWRSLYDRAFTV